MSPASLSPPVRRAAALAVLAAGLLVFWAVTVAPYRALLDEQETALEQGRDRLERLTRIASSAPALARALEAKAAAGTVASPYLEGASDSLAGATLHGRLGRLAEDAGLAVTSVEPVASEDASSGRVALGVAASGPLDGLMRFLHAIEAERPLLFVEELEIFNPSITEPRFDAGGQVQVMARLKVAGHRRPS